MAMSASSPLSQELPLPMRRVILSLRRVDQSTQSRVGQARSRCRKADKSWRLAVKALERCNADDDQRADAFSAQGIALLTQ